MYSVVTSWKLTLIFHAVCKCPCLWFQAGALLACGIVNSGVRNECDPALALLSDYVLHNNNIMRLGSVVG